MTKVRKAGTKLRKAIEKKNGTKDGKVVEKNKTKSNNNKKSKK